MPKEENAAEVAHRRATGKVVRRQCISLVRHGC